MTTASSKNLEYLDLIQKRAKDARERSNHLDLNCNEVSAKEDDLIFIDVFKIVSIKTDIDSLNFPLFSLRKNTVTTESVFENKDFKVTVTPSPKGQATIHDKDIWIYCVSKLAQAMYERKNIKSTVRFRLSDFLKTVGRNLSGRSHNRTKEALDRLDGTRIKIEYRDNKRVVTHKFGLIEGWSVIENENGRMSYIQITLPQWLVKSIQTSKVRKISPGYFNLSGAIDRRIYEIACKHCNNNPEWMFKLENLKIKCGSTSSTYGFRRSIKELAVKDNLPDYHIIYEPESDNVRFINRDPLVHEKAAKRRSVTPIGDFIDKIEKGKK